MLACITAEVLAETLDFTETSWATWKNLLGDKRPRLFCFASMDVHGKLTMRITLNSVNDLCMCETMLCLISN